MASTNIFKDMGTRGNFTPKLLGQSAPANTTAASIYSPPPGTQFTEITTIFVSNREGSANSFSLFLDNDGTTYDDTTALINLKSIAANDIYVLNNAGIFMNNSSGNLAVKTEDADELCFSVFGIEVTK